VSSERLLAFAAVVAVIVVVPGPDMAIVTRNALGMGLRAALASALGVEVGLVVWAGVSALGLAALLRASETVFTAVKVAGAAYLLWLGLRTLRDSRRIGSTETRRSGPPGRARARAAFRQGLVSNLLNPKIAVVYTTLIPQFVVRERPALLQTASLAAVLIALGFVWLTVYAVMVARAGDVLRRPRVRVWLERVTGTALVGFGARLALLRR
jgi:RhtB (resistance to homoserine/threonine) family protein